MRGMGAGYYALPCYNFKVNILEEKPIFQMAKIINRSTIFIAKLRNGFNCEH